MNTKEALNIAIIILSVLLTISVLLQVRGSGLSGVFGMSSGGEFYRSRRGLEKFLYYLTIFCAVGISTLSLISVII